MLYESDSPTWPQAHPRGGTATPARATQPLVERCERGRLTLQLPSGQRMTRHAGNDGPQAAITFRRWRGLWRLAVGGHLGFARSYMDGDWSTPDLKALLEFGARHEASPGMPDIEWLPTSPFNRLGHWWRANTRRGSRRNIAAHYDLGNAFYAAWLDRDMNYSSGLYLDAGQTLEQAQAAKVDRVVELLDLGGGERVLELGCGWGALAERLIGREGCSVTGLTLSTEQLDFARARLADKRLLDRGDLQLTDYRDIEGRFDRIVSIEMLEAVGESYWPAYFDKLRSCLADGGNAVLQVITIDQARFDQYRRRPDFIQRYIFPGGMLPTSDIVIREAQRAGLALRIHQNFGVSYARTLMEWRLRFDRAWPHIASLGFDAPFRRMWEFYLAYCQVGFEVGAIDVGLYKFERR